MILDEIGYSYLACKKYNFACMDTNKIFCKNILHQIGEEFALQVKFNKPEIK